MARDESEIKESIRRALALSEDESTTDGERANALAYATRLMTQHQIERAMLDDPTRREEVGTRKFTYSGSYTGQKSLLLGQLATSLGMKTVNYRVNRMTYDNSVVYGFESDLELLDMLYTSLLLQQTNGLRKAKVPIELFRAEVAGWKRDWLDAFTYTVCRRVKEAHVRQVETYDREHAGSGAPGAALVLASREDAIKQAYEAEHAGIKQRGNRALRHRSALLGGTAAGQRADIAQTRIGGQRRQVTGGR